MSSVDTIKNKIEKIEKLLTEVKNELNLINDNKPQLKRIRKDEPLPSEEELKAEYERLYEEFVAKNSQSIEEFIKTKNKAYLKVFCDANNLPLDANKVSKDRIADEVIRWMMQRKAIAKKAI